MCERERERARVCFYLLFLFVSRKRESHTMAWVVEKASLWEEWSQKILHEKYFSIKKKKYFVYMLGKKTSETGVLEIKFSGGSLA